MIFSKLYHTDIDCNKYNAKIYEDINVTITLTDFNENPVKYTSVSLSCTGGTLSSSSGLTNGNGTFTVTFTPSEWGIHSITCNSETVQLNIRGGWKTSPTTKSYSGVNTVTAQYNQDMVKIYMQGTFPSGTSPTTLATINSADAPSNNYVSPSHTQYGQVTVQSDGTINCIINTSGTNYWGCYYPRKTLNE